MSALLWLVWPTLGASLPACGGGSMTNDKPSLDPSAYTVSYRSLVRVPGDGVVMKEQAFVDQVSRLDPIAAKRCPVSNAASFQTAADALGGITWTHPIAILKDQSLPPLYQGRLPPPSLAIPGASASEGASAAPTIVRPDLVGYQDSTAIFLSQRHGLLAVKTDGAAPALSCALKLPGQPKYFFYRGNELVLLVNGLSVSEAALLRFRVTPTGFDFVDAIMLDQQSIQDARLFDSTLVVYTSLLTPVPPMTTPPAGAGAGAGGGSSSGAGSSAAVAVPAGGQGYNPSTGVAVTAVKWDAALAVAWHEEFLNDPAGNDPFAGQDPVMAAAKLAVGDVISTTKTFKPFISASDRYVVVSRDVTRTVFTGTLTQSYSYCATSHEGPARSVQSCAPKYEQRANPDYRAPQSTSGDYSCNGKTLLDCIQEAAPTVSKYIYVRVGESCSTYTYHDYICDKYTTNTVAYPTYSQEPSTQFVVYRYDAGDFVKLDEQLYNLADPGPGAVNVPSLTFSGAPLEVAGSIDQKGDLQFQNGQFYVLTNQGEQLHTLLLIGNSIAKLGTQAEPRQRSALSSYSGAHSTLFSADRMMISRAYYDPASPMNIPNWSDVIMLDLTTPAFPKPLNQFVMPGSSDQLILAADGVVGPGTVAFTSGGVARNLQKLTLFNRDDASELGNLLLGTEFNADFVSSWLGVTDDQRIRLDADNQRLFLPYAGTHHAPQDSFNPTAHRLNITAIANRLLTSEVTFDVAEDIVRTVSTSSAPNAGSALAFGDSSVYAINQTPGSWALDVVDEFATPIAVYRVSDQGDLHARIDRLGARCQISTFAGSLNAFKPDHVGRGPELPCDEGSLPTAIGLAVVFADASTGWQLSADGAVITALDAAAVKERLTHIRSDEYCALDARVEDGTPVPYLDTAPPSIVCFPFPTAGGGGVTGVSPAGGAARN
ncbi:MAG TPA: hypothetical protein VGK52_07660 [Polyangia bacterium]